SIYALYQAAVHRGEPFDVIVEVGQENIFSEFSKRRAGVARQPVFHDVLFLFHCLWSHLRARNNIARWIETLPVQCDTAKFAGFHQCRRRSPLRWRTRRQTRPDPAVDQGGGMFSLDNGRETRFLTRSKVCAVPSALQA